MQKLPPIILFSSVRLIIRWVELRLILSTIIGWLDIAKFGLLNGWALANEFANKIKTKNESFFMIKIIR